jgi:hypothetical protein
MLTIDKARNVRIWEIGFPFNNRLYSIIINKREFINKEEKKCGYEEEIIYNINNTRDWDERNSKFMMNIFNCVNF